MASGNTWKLAALSGVPFFMVLGNSMLIPVFPQMQQTLNITPLQAGLTITLFSIPAGISIPLLGFLSDKIGRKKILIPALIMYGLGGLVSGLAVWLLPEPYPVLLAGRIIQGIGAAGTAPIAMALVGDIFQNQERSKALGVIEAANGLGKVVSPILGSLIAVLLIWHALFFVYSFLAVPIAAGIWLAIKEPPLKTKDRTAALYLKTLKKIFVEKGKSLAGCYLAGSIVLMVLFGVLSYMSDILETRYNLKGISKGFAIAIPVLAMAITSYASGRFLQKRGFLLKFMVILGLASVAASLLLIAIFPMDWIFFGGVTLMGIGTGLVLPAVNTLVTSSVPLEERGGITALYGSVRFFGVALGPPSFSLLLEVSKQAMLMAGGLLALAGAVFCVLLINQEKLIKDLSKSNSGFMVGGKMGIILRRIRSWLSPKKMEPN
ncbi:MAG: MFS transporter [Syntrophomonadaceae bacterium]|nr:MFS transporter [Syntrophomonadaceae bacterium]